MTDYTCSHQCATCSHQYCAAKVALFEHLNEVQLQQVVQRIEHHAFKKGAIVFNQGEPSDRLYIVNKGSLKVFNYTPDGKEQILYILSDGDFLGDLNLLKSDTFHYYGQTLEDTLLCTLSKEAFNKILTENPEINEEILNYAYERITELERLVQTLTTKDVDSKLATLLISLSDSFGIKKREGIEISLSLSREDMANYLGLTRETVSRKLSLFQNERIIDLIGSKKILILDSKKLNQLRRR